MAIGELLRETELRGQNLDEIKKEIKERRLLKGNFKLPKPIVKKGFFEDKVYKPYIIRETVVDVVGGEDTYWSDIDQTTKYIDAGKSEYVVKAIIRIAWREETSKAEFLENFTEEEQEILISEKLTFFDYINCARGEGFEYDPVKVGKTVIRDYKIMLEEDGLL